MNEDFWLILAVAVVWAALAAVYALAPWGGMLGYARVWGAGSVLFLGLAGLLARRRVAKGRETDDRVAGNPAEAR